MNIEFAKQVLKTKSLEKSPWIKMKIDWFGFDVQLELSRRKLFVQIDTSKPSQLKRSWFLPRTSTLLRLDQSQFSFKSAPVLETLNNLSSQTLTWKKFNQVAQIQLSEIEAPRTPAPRLRPTTTNARSKRTETSLRH